TGQKPSGNTKTGHGSAGLLYSGQDFFSCAPAHMGGHPRLLGLGRHTESPEQVSQPELPSAIPRFPDRVAVTVADLGGPHMKNLRLRKILLFRIYVSVFPSGGFLSHKSRLCVY